MNAPWEPILGIIDSYTGPEVGPRASRSYTVTLCAPEGTIQATIGPSGDTQWDPLDTVAARVGTRFLALRRNEEVHAFITERPAGEECAG